MTDIGKNRLQRIPADMNRIAADGKTPLLERIDARDRYPVIPAIQHFLDDRRLTGIRHRLLGLGGKERHQRKEQQRQTEQASFHNGKGFRHRAKDKNYFRISNRFPNNLFDRFRRPSSPLRAGNFLQRRGRISVKTARNPNPFLYDVCAAGAEKEAPRRASASRRS